MGYLTNYQLNLYNDTYDERDFDKVVSEIEKISGYHFEREASDSIKLDDATWYDAKENLKEVAKKFPDVIIELLADGEASDDLWEARFHGDKFEKQDTEMVTPPFQNILLPAESTPKAKYQRFQEALRRWLRVSLVDAEQDAIEALRQGPIDLTEYPFGQQLYFFICQETGLYCKKAYLDEKGKVAVEAGLSEYPEDTSYCLEWTDISQDVPTLNDFMDCIYGNKDNILDEE